MKKIQSEKHEKYAKNMQCFYPITLSITNPYSSHSSLFFPSLGNTNKDSRLENINNLVILTETREVWSGLTSESEKTRFKCLLLVYVNFWFELYIIGMQCVNALDFKDYSSPETASRQPL